MLTPFGLHTCLLQAVGPCGFCASPQNLLYLAPPQGQGEAEGLTIMSTGDIRSSLGDCHPQRMSQMRTPRLRGDLLAQSREESPRATRGGRSVQLKSKSSFLYEMLSAAAILPQHPEDTGKGRGSR